MKYIFIGIIVLLTAFSCTKDIGKIPAAVPPGVIDTCSTNIKYSQHISHIIATNCALPTCHVSGAQADFSNYAALKTEINLVGATYFLSRVSPGGGMPPSNTPGPTTLSNCDLTKLQTWVNEGAQNN